MKAQNHKHLLAAALAALVSLIAVPAAMAEPPTMTPGSAPVSAPALTGSGVTTQGLDTSASAPSAGVNQTAGSQTAGSPGPSSPGPAAAGGGPAAQDPSAPGPAAAAGSGAGPGPPTDTAPGSSSGGVTSADGAGAGADQSPQPLPALPSSSATTQTIVQVQNLGCTAHCVGSSQSQVAQQTNLTIQPVSASQPGASGRVPAPASSVTNLVQLQLGCVAHCFGSTTLASPGQPGSQSFVPPTPPDLGPSAQSVVDQSSVQVQEGLGLVSSQSQVAAQVNASVQDVGTQLGWISTALGPGAGDVLSLLADAGGSLGLPANPSSGALAAGDGSTAVPSPVGQAISQVEQAIWQVQIGCLIFCTQTQQSQQAAQSTTTVGVLGDQPAEGTLPPPVTQTYQLVWQLQVGCLFWCYDTVESQTASITNAVESLVAPQPPPSPGDVPAPPTIAPGQAGSPTAAAAAPVSPPLAGPPAPAAVSAASVGGLPGPFRIGPRDPGPRLRVRVGHLPLPVVTGAVTSALPASIPGAAAPRSLSLETPSIGETAGVTRELRQVRHADPRRSDRHRAKEPNLVPPQTQATPSGTSWTLVALAAVVALLAAALVVSDLRQRWSRRVGT